MYSLTDQYMENLASYYEKDDLKSESMIVVGDATVPYSSKTVINANKLSDVKNILNQVYADKEDYKSDEILDSDAYIYMKTGEIPKDAPKNYEIAEIDSVKVDGVTFKTFAVEYDTEYENEETSTDDKDKEPVIVHTQQLACYTDTEDAIEILVVQEEYDQEKGIELLHEFIGAKG